MFRKLTILLTVSLWIATNSSKISDAAYCFDSDDNDALIARFENLLLEGNYRRLGQAIRNLEAAGLGKGNHQLKFLKGLSALENGNSDEAWSYLTQYLKTPDAVYREHARELLNSLSSPTPRSSSTSQFTNSIGMQMVRIPTGSFFMGSKNQHSSVQVTFDEVTSHDPKRFADEHPRHLVNITNHFYAGKFEVTIGQFRQFVADTGYQTDALKKGGTMDGYDPNSAQTTPTAEWVKANWRNGGDQYPVSYVSWNDANAFVLWLGKKENKHYRLPTEAEWEYFARAGTTTYFSTGDSQNSLAGFANVPDLTFKSNIEDIQYAVVPTYDGYVGKAPVGQFKPNPFGLYDIHGNVFEWCYDGYAANGYQYHDKTNPYIKADTQFRVIRGGCYM